MLLIRFSNKIYGEIYEKISSHTYNDNLILLLQGINSNTNQDQISVFKILENEILRKTG